MGRRFFFLTPLICNLLALAAIVAGGIFALRELPLLAQQARAAGWPPLPAAGLAYLPLLYGAWVLGVLELAHGAMLRRLGHDADFRRQLSDSRSDHYNRRFTVLLATVALSFPLIRVEFLAVTGPGVAAVKGVMLAASALLASALFGRVQYGERQPWMLSLIYFTLAVAFNGNDLADPGNFEWLALLVMAGIVLPGEILLARRRHLP